MTPKADSEDRKNFAGRIARIPIGNTGVMQLGMTVSKLRAERSAADIRAMPSDGVFRCIELAVRYINDNPHCTASEIARRSGFQFLPTSIGPFGP